MDSAYWSYDNIVPSFRLDGKLVILTGGSGGLAAVVSRALLAKGADVALVDMNLERTQQAARDVLQWGEEQMKVNTNHQSVR